MRGQRADQRGCNAGNRGNYLKESLTAKSKTGHRICGALVKSEDGAPLFKDVKMVTESIKLSSRLF